MTVTGNVTERGTVPAPEPHLTAADVVARAEALAPELAERQSETEQRTYYAEDTHEAFTDAGLYRILVPRRYGGYEFGVRTFFQVVMTLTRACPSTGWMYCLGSAHALAVASLFGERTQAEVFGDGHFICPATVSPNGTAQRTGDGDWTLRGTWPYCSGSPYATHFLGHTLVSRGPDGPPEPMLFIAPRDQWRRLDDWGRSLGLKGSGSHSICFEDGRVPDHFTLANHLSLISVVDGTPGLALHGNPLYGGGQMSFMVMEDALLAVGMARAALDAYEELMTRDTVFPPIRPRTHDPDYQRWYGEAVGLVTTARAALAQLVHEWEESCVDGPAVFTPERELRIAVSCREIVRLCWQAVESRLVPTAGSSSVRNGARVERVWRDLSMLHSHAGVAVFLSGIAQRELAKVRFGVE